MAMGILAVFDMAGIDVGVNVHRANAHRVSAGSDATTRPTSRCMRPADSGRRAARATTATSRAIARASTTPRPSRSCARSAHELQIPQRKHTAQEIQERCLFPLINEGFRVLDEGIALRAADIDVVWTAGYGFPRYRGGPMFHAEVLGLETLLNGMRRYRDLFGPMHWEPAPLLVELVERKLSIAQWERDQRAKRAQS